MSINKLKTLPQWRFPHSVFAVSVTLWQAMACLQDLNLPASPLGHQVHLARLHQIYTTWRWISLLPTFCGYFVNLDDDICNLRVGTCTRSEGESA